MGGYSLKTVFTKVSRREVDKDLTLNFDGESGILLSELNSYPFSVSDGNK